MLRPIVCLMMMMMMNVEAAWMNDSDWKEPELHMSLPRVWQWKQSQGEKLTACSFVLDYGNRFVLAISWWSFRYDDYAVGKMKWYVSV